MADVAMDAKVQLMLSELKLPTIRSNFRKVANAQRQLFLGANDN